MATPVRECGNSACCRSQSVANSAPVRMFGILLGMILFVLSTTRRALSLGRVTHCPQDASAALKMSPSTVLHIMDNGYTTASNVHVDGGARLV